MHVRHRPVPRHREHGRGVVSLPARLECGGVDGVVACARLRRADGVRKEPTPVEALGGVLVGTCELPLSVRPYLEPVVVAARRGVPYRNSCHSRRNAHTPARRCYEYRQAGARGVPGLYHVQRAHDGRRPVRYKHYRGLPCRPDVLVEQLGCRPEGGRAGGVDGQHLAGVRVEHRPPRLSRLVKVCVGQDVIEEDLPRHLLGPGELLPSLERVLHMLHQVAERQPRHVDLRHELHQEVQTLPLIRRQPALQASHILHAQPFLRTAPPRSQTLLHRLGEPLNMRPLYLRGHRGHGDGVCWPWAVV
mmetsp:Transcript_53281/g.134171  ORF Transcript_53281/g.134171 Transcript_53281/m.134171 type:complete len:304 (+) Transcript_53281:363-1274(+)